jgi:hypothetical protein
MNIMKTNGTLPVLHAIILLLLSQFISRQTLAQPDYDFRNAVLLSGTDKQIGAQYRFPNVRPGTDALVTITDITGGIVLNQLDGGSGFAEAFQPVLQVPAYSSGYVEFRIDFVETGTSNPQVMLEIPATPIDVDGAHYSSGNVYEFDMLTMAAGSYVDYSMLGGELDIHFSAGWVTGKNIAAIDYPGVDTVARQAMFTTVNSNISSFIFRTGAENNSNASVQRLRSLYFKKFVYEYSFLSRSSLLSFQGNEKTSGVELKWELALQHDINKVIVEKATTANQYFPIGEIAASKSAENTFSFYDHTAIGSLSLYRLRLVSVSGAVRYSSVLAFRDKIAANDFRIYPSTIQQSATLNVRAEKAEVAGLQIVDMNGRLVSQKNISLSQGVNNLPVSDLAKLTAGNYVAVLKMGGRIYNQKLVKQ